MPDCDCSMTHSALLLEAANVKQLLKEFGGPQTTLDFKATLADKYMVRFHNEMTSAVESVLMHLTHAENVDFDKVRSGT